MAENKKKSKGFQIISEKYQAWSTPLLKTTVVAVPTVTLSGNESVNVHSCNVPFVLHLFYTGTILKAHFLLS